MQFIGGFAYKSTNLKRRFCNRASGFGRDFGGFKINAKNGELVSLLTLKLGKKQDAIYANKILYDISSNARLVGKTLEGIGLGLRSTAECICQEYEQLLAKIHKNIKYLEKIGGKAISD